MSLSSTDKGLLTPDNCAVIFIDHQPQMFFGVANIDRQDLLNNVLVLAKAAKIFRVPVILTAVESEVFSGNITPQLLDLFPNQTLIERSNLNSWENKELITAVKSTARNNFLIAALWSETCLVFPALQMLEEGYGIYAVEDASGGTSKAAHDAAIRRIEQAGAVSLTAFQVLLEFQRDWSRKEHYEEVMAVVKEHCGAYGQGIEYAATMVQKEPASRNRRSSNTMKAQSKTPTMANVVTKHSISSELAQKMVDEAVAKARELGVTENVAILDDGGNLKAFSRMDGAPILSIGIAQNKAYTALFGISTQEMFNFIQGDPSLLAGMPTLPRMAAWGGGFPIKVNGEVVGAIGLSGAPTVQNDVDCAMAALALLPDAAPAD
ncbi:MAG: isochorismatase family protein [Chthoniobacterales bacterium]